MGLAGQYFAKSAIFFGAAALCIPALIALSRIRADEIDYARARNAGMGKQATSYHRIFDLGKTAIYTSLLPAFSYSNSPMLRCCRLLARTWRKARPNTPRYSWLA